MTDSSLISFDGQTFLPDRDGERLTRQHHRVLALMRDGAWRTLAEIAKITGDPEASVSARLRSLRTEKFGGYKVERRYIRRGLHAYRLVVGQLELPNA